MDSATVKEPILLMARYNLWANDQFISFFRRQEPDLIEKFVPGSFPSIRKTLMHIWDAQYIWHRRLLGESPVTFPSSSWSGSLDEMYDGLNKSSKELIELVRSLAIYEMQEVIRYTTMTAGPQASKRYEVLLHVFNHSMYHRGQCVTMARTLSMEGIPSTDLIKYLRT